MTEKRQTSRFSDLITAARSRKLRDEIPENHEQNTSITKSTDPNYTRTTIYLPKALHRKFKVAAALEGRQMSDIVTELIEEWLKKTNQKAN